MTHWKRYAAALIALSIPTLAGCGHSQDTTAGPETQAAPPSAAQQAAQAQDAERAAQQGAAARAAAATQGKP